MCGPISLLFIAIPVLEIWVMIQVGRQVGLFETLALLALSAVIGLSIAKNQGLSALRRVQQGEVPPEAELLAGPLLLVAALLLVVPGFVSDAFGFVLLVPPVRRIVARRLARRMERGRISGRWQGTVHFGGGRRPPADRSSPGGPPVEGPGVIDVEVVKRERADTDPDA